MKGFWKVSFAACLLILLILSGACGNQDNKPEPEKSLYEHGLELISLMREMAGNDVYLSIYSDNEEIPSILRKASVGVETQPQAVYRIYTGETDFFRLIGVSLEDLPESLQQILKEKAASAAVTQVNAMGGSTTLAAASLCTAQRVFVSDSELEQNEIYLYVYESAAPAAVIFTEGEGGAVLASGMFVLYDQFSAGSLEEVRQALADFGVTVEKVMP